MVIEAEPSLPIVRLITRLNIGGPARQALLLTRQLAPQFPTTLAAGAPAVGEGELSDPAVQVRRVPLVRPLRPDADARAAFAVRQLLVETRARLLHTHMAKAGTVGRWAALTLRPRPRTVHTFHGHVLDGYFKPTVQRAFTEIERNLARRTDALVAVSTEIRDALLDLGIGRPHQFHVIPLGLDLSPFLAVDGPSGALRRAIGIGADVPLVSAIGRLVPIKDLGTLLAAVALLPGVHLALVGDGEMRTRLQAQTVAMGLAARVHFTGWFHDVPAALSDSDVVALTSRNEGTPVSLIEAAAAARPVVATAVGGVPQVVLDGVTGYLAGPGRSEDIAGLLHRLVADPERRACMGEAGRRHVRQRFSHERLVRDIRDLYAGLL
jgi:glycosyltransferase involved in cell wall biosynthesis